VVEKRTANGDYCNGGLDTKATELVAPDDLCALVAADSRALLALLDARRTAGKDAIPIYASVPGNPTIPEADDAARNIIRARRIPVSETEGLGWIAADLLSAGRLQSGENRIVLVENYSNPGSEREVAATKEWFRRKYPIGSPKEVVVVEEGVSCGRSATYDAEDVAARISAQPNVRAILVIGDPASHIYRGPILEVAFRLRVPTFWESFPALSEGGTICWAGNRTVPWADLTNQIRGRCLGLEPSPPEAEMVFAAFGNAAAARELLNIDTRSVDRLAGVRVWWLETPFLREHREPPFPAEVEWPKPPE